MKTKLILTGALLLGLGGNTIVLSQANTAKRESQLLQTEALEVVRSINTAELDLFLTTKSYVSLEKLLQHRFFKGGKMEVLLTDSTSGRLKHYKLSVVASPDGKHYQVTLVPESGCEFALFSNESGLIYEGKALGCPSS